MKKKPHDTLKTVPGLVHIKLQVTPEEREKIRQIASGTEHRNMAVWCRELVRRELAKSRLIQ